MLTLIVPAYNEREAIGGTIIELQKAFQHRQDVEILVVDDGSTDGTSDIIKREFPDLAVIRHGVNRGYGASLKSGIRQARGDLIGIIDADGTYPIHALVHLVNVMESDPATDMAVGARNWIPPERRAAKYVLGELAKVLVGRDIPDLNSGCRVFKKSWAERFMHLYPDGFSLTTTITLAMLSEGANVKYELIEYRGRTGESKIAPFRDTMNFFILIVRCILYFNPIKVLLPVAGMMFLLGTAVAFISWLETGKITDITVLSCYFLSIQMAVLAFLADMISKRSR